jgi:hypothetical protein
MVGVRVRIHQPYVGFKVLESLEDPDWLIADGRFLSAFSEFHPPQKP